MWSSPPLRSLRVGGGAGARHTTARRCVAVACTLDDAAAPSKAAPQAARGHPLTHADASHAPLNPHPPTHPPVGVAAAYPVQDLDVHISHLQVWIGAAGMWTGAAGMWIGAADM